MLWEQLWFQRNNGPRLPPRLGDLFSSVSFYFFPPSAHIESTWSSRGSLSCESLMLKACRLIFLQSAGKASQTPRPTSPQLCFLIPLHAIIAAWTNKDRRPRNMHKICDVSQGRMSIQHEIWLIRPPIATIACSLEVGGTVPPPLPPCKQSLP